MAAPRNRGASAEVIRGASQDFRSKKVRAKDIMTPQKETSRSDRAAPLRGAGWVVVRNARRSAANWLGGVNSKCGDLPLFHIQNEQTKIFSIRA